MGAGALTREMGHEEQAESLDELHVRAAQRDPAAFAPLYTAYFRPVYGYCARLLRDPQAAADATSETFARALKGLPRYRARTFRGWLFTIAHNVVVDQTRRRRPTTPIDAIGELADGAVSPEEWFLAREGDIRVARLLRSLSERQRQVMELRVAGLRSAEIAEVLGMQVGAVRTAQFRALQQLRRMLGGDAISQEQRDVDL